MQVRTPSGWRPKAVMQSLSWVQEVVYIVVGLLLVVAAIGVIAGTVEEIINSVNEGTEPVTIGLRILDRILLLLIVAELLHTLRLVLYEGEIFAEPFLLVGLIAVVRRVVVVTAQVEQRPTHDLLLELGVLAALALAFGAAIYLLRRGSAQESEMQKRRKA